MTDYALFCEAVAYLLLAHVAVAFMPFRWITRWMAKPAVPSGQVPALRVIRAVERASRYLPLRVVCIHRGIASQRMLRRRGYDARFIYGLMSGDDALAAHVWVELAGEKLIGGEEAQGFCRVASFPALPDTVHANEQLD